MRTLAAAGNTAARALAALMVPASALAQEAARPVTQDMDVNLTPILLGLIAVALVVVAFAVVRRVFRGAGAARSSSEPAGGRHVRP